MNIFSDISTITITCHKRLSIYLAQEIIAMGFPIIEQFITGVRLQGTLNDCIKLNLNLRCASQVLFSLKQFVAEEPDTIHLETLRIPWEEILENDGYFSVTSNINNPTINNSMFANLRVKDGIVDRLRNKRGIRPSTGAELSGAVVHLFWKNDQAELFIDTSGASLARHGYRKIPGLAPMLESLASATIYASQWDKTSPFVNPMCGSGTLAIEAALIATNRKPGLYRENFAFMHLQGYDKTIYEQETRLLNEQIFKTSHLKIIASDNSPKAIENSRKNAEAAGVAHLIDFVICDFAATPIPSNQQGVVFMNPEYGERLGEIEQLEITYKQMGDFFKQKCGGYWGYIFTGNLELAKKIGLKTNRKIEFYNSTIDCRLLEYELYSGSKDAKKID